MFNRDKRKSGPEVVEFWSSGYPSQDVVGESHYTDHLKRIARRYGPGDHLVDEVLMPEPENRYDANAIAVQVDGGTVGYLPREVAAAYSGVLKPLQAAGQVGSVPARLWTGTDVNNEVYGSARVALAPPGLLLPINHLPPDAIELPTGSRIQVTREDDHLEALAPVLGNASELAVYVTIHTAESEGPRVTKRVVLVRLDAVQVGQLSAQMTREMLPIVDLAERTGQVLGARAAIRGNRLKVEVVLDCLKASELSDDFIRRLEDTPRLTGMAVDVKEGSSGAELGRDVAAVEPAASPAPAVEPSAPEVEAPLPKADWYPDPLDEAKWRYWDGTVWTDHTAPR